MPQVVKQDGSRTEFDLDKLRTSFMRALHKRPVPTALVDEAIATHHAASAGAGRARNAVAPDRRDGDEGTAQARQGRLHPLRVGVQSFQDVDDFQRRDQGSAQAGAASSASAPLQRALAATTHVHTLTITHYMARALELARARPLHHHAQSARRLRDRARRRGRRRRLARASRRAACRNHALTPPAREAARRDRLCDAGTLHPSRPHAAVRRCADRGGCGARGGGDAGPESAGARARVWRACARRASRSSAGLLRSTKRANSISVSFRA